MIDHGACVDNCINIDQLGQYQDRINAIIKNRKARAVAGVPQISNTPKLCTVDGSQGLEAPIVIFDGSYQYANFVGKLVRT